MLAASFFLALLADLALCRGALRRVLDGGLENPDSYMRLVRIADAQAAGHWFGADVMRDGTGANIHWSHLLDALILALALPLRLVLDLPAALQLAAASIGPLSLGALAVALAWALAPLAAPAWRLVAVALAVLSPGVLAYAQPGVAHHHVLLAAAAVALAGCCGRAALGDRRAGLWAGLIGGLGIWLSPELMPFLLLGFAAMPVLWAGGQAAAAPAARAAGLAFLAVILAAWLLDPPAAGRWSVEIDRLSVVWVGLGLALAAAGIALPLAQRVAAGRLARPALGLAAAGLALLAWMLAFPVVLRGPDGLMSAAEAAAFFGPIREMQPVDGVAGFLAFAGGGLLAVLGAAWLAWQRRALPWAYAALAGLPVLAIATWHVRFATYAELLAALMLPVLLAATPRLRLQLPAAVLRPALVACFLLLPAAAGLALATPALPQAACAVRAAVAGRDLGGEIVLGRIDDSPEFLYWSRARTVGSLYHRGIAAYMRARAAWRLRNFAVLPPEIAATGATLLAICPASGRPGILASLPPDTLYDALRAGTPPSWLRLVAAPAGSGYRLYRVVRP